MGPLHVDQNSVVSHILNSAEVFVCFPGKAYGRIKAQAEHCAVCTWPKKLRMARLHISGSEQPIYQQTLPRFLSHL